MKQYTTPEQTYKLIELGFKPKVEIKEVQTVDSEIHVYYDCYFTIGELIEVLPESASQRLRYVATKRAWIVDVDVLGKDGKCHRGIYYAELIDALYDMVIKLKEEGVI